eukprot:sb/3476854/
MVSQPKRSYHYQGETPFNSYIGGSFILPVNRGSDKSEDDNLGTVFTVVIRHNCHLAIQSTIQNEALIQSERDVKTKGERGVEGRHHFPIALSLRSVPHSESWIESWMADGVAR